MNKYDSQIISPAADLAKGVTKGKPTMGGTFNSTSIKGQDLPQRTHSSAACDEKLFEVRPDAPIKKG